MVVQIAMPETEAELNKGVVAAAEDDNVCFNAAIRCWYSEFNVYEYLIQWSCDALGHELEGGMYWIYKIYT